MRYRLAAWLVMAGSVFAADTCVDCHSVLDGNLQAPAKKFSGDIHSRFGFSCADCHGGDPNATDPEVSMSKAPGFVGKIPRAAIPERCARCHSNAALIEKYKPRQRVDQLVQYKTSVHGKKLAAGDTAVATCIDCHSVHDIREVKDAVSPVHPLRLPETCARCHADAKHMAPYKLDTNQFAGYRKSVHWEALAKRGDLSAPSCASCHGNHGAQPPQVESVAAVCGSCHVMMEELYKKSPHEPVFAAMGAAGCVVCHGNHEIKNPGIGMLAGANSVCSQCHDADSKGGVAAADMASQIGGLEKALDKSDEILAVAQQSGMEVSEALLRQREGRENLVKAAVAVHAFQPAAVRKPVQEGMAIAAETLRAGNSALGERRVRRFGLMVSLIAIAITMLGLWLAIRKIERRAATERLS
ncbi:MAG TPA: cytochrome c3 family protein [Bryobacteraceae bacterium]|nr:cytochrome c3 family protein [Bryobacteraceae bacterium]